MASARSNFSPEADVSVHLTELGLLLGTDTLLMRWSSPDPSSLLAVADRERLIALLSILARRPLSPDILHHVEAASIHWRRGDKALAQIRLTVSALPRLSCAADAERLRLAARCLDEGVTPHRLMKDLDLATTALDVSKFNPNHVPAGNGRASGQFESGSGESVAFLSPSALAALVRRATPSILDPNLSPTLIDSLAAFAVRFAVPTAVLGTLLIPTPNSGGVTEGILPEADGIRFRHDGPAGLLALAYKLADGSEVRIRTESRHGLFIDPKTATAIGRDLGEQLALDLPALHLVLAVALQANHKERPKPWAAIDEDEPKLCPAPTPDKAHNPKEHVLDYEDDVHRRVNPVHPIPRGFAIQIIDPATGETQYPDDCFRFSGDLVDGDMERGDFADAKGEEYESLLSKQGISDVVLKKLADVSRRHLRAAEAMGRHLKIYFAEIGAAFLVREAFAKDADLRRIKIGYLPPSKPKSKKARSR